PSRAVEHRAPTKTRVKLAGIGNYWGARARGAQCLRRDRPHRIHRGASRRARSLPHALAVRSHGVDVRVAVCRDGCAAIATSISPATAVAVNISGLEVLPWRPPSSLPALRFVVGLA